MAARQPDPVQRFERTVNPATQRTYHLHRPEQHRVHWGCPECEGQQEVAIVTRRAARDGAAVEAWLGCPECLRQRRFALTDHALERWRQRVGQPVHALRALIEGLHVERPSIGQPARLHPPTATLLPVEVEAGGRDIVARTVKCPIYSHGRLQTDRFERCRACQQQFDPTRTPACPWCEVSITYQTTPEVHQ